MDISDDGKEYFVHASAMPKGITDIKSDTRFDLPNERGLMAKNVTLEV